MNIPIIIVNTNAKNPIPIEFQIANSSSNVRSVCRSVCFAICLISSGNMNTALVSAITSRDNKR